MKTAFVTGASSGIGRATAQALLHDGWNVIGTTRRQPPAKGDLGKNFTLVRMELTDRDSVRTAVAAALERSGRIDLLVNNAGYHVFGFFEEVKDEDLVEQFETNLMGAIWVMRDVIPHMRQQRSGTIINVTSLAAFVGPALNTFYAASKWGLEGLTEALVAELWPFGIRVRLVEPGLTQSNIEERRNNQEIIAIADYDALRDVAYAAIKPDTQHNGSSADLIAKEILKAAHDTSRQLRFPAGIDAQAVFTLRQQLSDEEFLEQMRQRFPI